MLHEHFPVQAAKAAPLGLEVGNIGLLRASEAHEARDGEILKAHEWQV
eukprot:CAMPEP_0170302250 /NCGR_PEP_ID=MMETSP0116_2-20130129/51405_1 /TAXON_ID=400756 /ORGANISM="Durinskia baltica, Strain CSIRO CS-38" /LENGTH=47 /DNA_ID= /DNA_START= /DNA_END= /DNA_ORIENTATION=